jgi:DegV family protein with EDD domain
VSIRIVTDSTCDLPPAVVAQYGITVVPLYINIGDRGYLDGIELSRQEFYQRLPSYDPPPTTATPGPEVFCQVYEKLAAQGATEVLSIHISISLSATVNTAKLCAQEKPSVPVTVFDSKQLSLGTGFLVVKAAQAAAEGGSMQEIVALLEEQTSRTHVFAALDTLEFLRRSGRMNAVLSTLGELLQIKPFLKMYDGKPSAERVRTRKHAMKRLVELLYQYSPFERVALLHSDALDRAQALLQEVKDILPDKEIWFEQINPVLGTHIGPGVVGFACVSKN